MNRSESSAIERLDRILAAYLQEADNSAGNADSLMALQARYLAEHAEFATDLRAYFEDQRIFTTLGSLPDDLARALPRYADATQIGSGAMGAVFRAFDRELKRWVALKVPTAMTVWDVRRLRDEAESLARLEHPNIVEVYDVIEYQGLPIISMRLITGGSLADQLIRLRGDPSRVARIMRDLARAVHYAHQRGILHRDLKPSNVLLDSDEPGLDRPYVSDFGLAREIGPSSRTEVLGASAQYRVIGTVPYMSPEQASGQRATTLSDVYGLGAILYELLTGEAPFSSDGERDQLALVRDLARMPQRPRQSHPRVDRTLEAICLKCLAKDSEQRYRSAEGLAKDLDRWLQHWPTEARPPHALGRTMLWARRSPVGVALVLALAGLATLLGVNLADRLQEPRRTHTMLADQRAGEFGLRLQQLGQAVASTAAEPSFPELLRAQNYSALQTFIAEIGDRSNDPNRLSPFESWFVIDNRDGQIKARWPTMSAETEGVDFRGRDYFKGLSTRRAAAGVHVSQVFRGLSDGLYKFGISAWIRDHDTPLGVVVATVTTSPQMGFLPTERGGVVTALLARRDSYLVPRETGAPPDGASPFVILLHPGYERRSEPVWFPQVHMAAVTRGTANPYEDPIAASHTAAAARYSGRWIAAFAPVENSPFVLIVQKRETPAVISLRAIIVIALAMLLLVVLAFRHPTSRGTAAMRVPPPAIPPQ